MKLKFTNFLSVTFILYFLLFFNVALIKADDTTPTPTPTPADNSSAIQSLEDQISGLESKISDLQGQEKSLSNDIAVMDDKISLIQSQIDLTKAKINGLTNDINNSQQQITQLNGSLQNLTKVLYAHIINTYEQSNIQPIEVLATSNSVSDYVQKRSYLQLVQEHDKKLIFDTQQAQDNFIAIKKIKETQKQQVVALQTQLVDETNQLGQ